MIGRGHGRETIVATKLAAMAAPCTCPLLGNGFADDTLLHIARFLRSPAPLHLTWYFITPFA